MNTPHKHADVLRAIAEKGFEAVEFLWSAEKDAWCTATQGTNPLTHHCYTWRIKPEPKPDVVVYNMVTPQIASGMLEAVHYEPGRGHNMRYVFDGETGKLKSAEVL
jgi:hypothetical protein